MGAFAAGAAGATPVTAVIAGLATLAKLFGLFGGGVKGSIKAITTVLQHTINIIAGPISAALAIMAGAIRELVQRLRSLVESILQRVRNIMGPLIAYAQRVRSLIDHIYDRMIAPVLQTIQHVRNTLAIFRIFHLRFADKIDKALFSLERRLAIPLIEARQKINQILTWAELIEHPEVLWSQSVVLRAILTTERGIIALIRGVGFSDRTNSREANRALAKLKVTRQDFSGFFQRVRTDQLTRDERELRRSALVALQSGTVQ